MEEQDFVLFLQTHVTEDELISTSLLLLPLELVQDFYQIGHKESTSTFFFFLRLSEVCNKTTLESCVWRIYPCTMSA